MKKLRIYKKDNKLQRSDTSIDKNVVATLTKMIFSGKTIFPKEGYVPIENEEGEIVREVSISTIKKWVERNNVIPETGMTLRDVLNDARVEYRRKERERKQKEMIEEAEASLHRTIRLRTNVPVVGMFGIVKDDKGNIVRKENSQLLKVKMDTAQFLLERLDPEKYGKKETTTNKHLVMSLSDLRRAKEEMSGGKVREAEN